MRKGLKREGEKDTGKEEEGGEKKEGKEKPIVWLGKTCRSRKEDQTQGLV